MDLVRKDNTANASSYIRCSSLDLYIRIIIDVYSSSDINRKFWLTDREKEFYIATVIHVIHNYLNPISEEALQIYKKYFNHTTGKAKISDYINKIRKKGWLKYDKRKKVVEIPKIFHGIDADKDFMYFNLGFSYEQIDRSDTDGDTGQE